MNKSILLFCVILFFIDSRASKKEQARFMDNIYAKDHPKKEDKSNNVLLSAIDIIEEKNEKKSNDLNDNKKAKKIVANELDIKKKSNDHNNIEKQIRESLSSIKSEEKENNEIIKNNIDDLKEKYNKNKSLIVNTANNIVFQIISQDTIHSGDQNSNNEKNKAADFSNAVIPLLQDQSAINKLTSNKLSSSKNNKSKNKKLTKGEIIAITASVSLFFVITIFILYYIKCLKGEKKGITFNEDFETYLKNEDFIKDKDVEIKKIGEIIKNKDILDKFFKNGITKISYFKDPMNHEVLSIMNTTEEQKKIFKDLSEFNEDIFEKQYQSGINDILLSFQDKLYNQCVDLGKNIKEDNNFFKNYNKSINNMRKNKSIVSNKPEKLRDYYIKLINKHFDFIIAYNNAIRKNIPSKERKEKNNKSSLGKFTDKSSSENIFTNDKNNNNINKDDNNSNKQSILNSNISKESLFEDIVHNNDNEEDKLDEEQYHTLVEKGKILLDKIKEELKKSEENNKNFIEKISRENNLRKSENEEEIDKQEKDILYFNEEVEDYQLLARVTSTEQMHQKNNKKDKIDFIKIAQKRFQQDESLKESKQKESKADSLMISNIVKNNINYPNNSNIDKINQYDNKQPRSYFDE